jgi:hypothetical protein
MAFSLQDKAADNMNPDEAGEEEKKKLHQAKLPYKISPQDESLTAQAQWYVYSKQYMSSKHAWTNFFRRCCMLENLLTGQSLHLTS